MNAHQPPLRDDAGLSLIELIVAVVVGGIVMSAMVMIFVNSWKTQEEVISVTDATNRGQLVSSAIERAMRNALYFEVSEGGVVGTTGSVLHVRTSLPGGLKCQAFQLTAGSAPDFGTVHWATSVTAVPGTLPAWRTGIQKLGAAEYFTRTAGDTLTYTFNIDTDAAPVTFTGDIAPRSILMTGSDGCW